MAKKKRSQMQRRPTTPKPKKKKPSSTSQPQPPKPLTDRRAMEKTMIDLGKLLQNQEFESIDEINAYVQNILASGGQIPSSEPDTPLEEAQSLMYQAFDATGARRVRLARKALEISEDCADAYVLLAEEAAPSLEEARRLYELGVKAGERALGPERFEEDAGHFWGIIETRPYMRARAGLAGCLWQLGERAAAIEHYQDMLRLNPGDNQGIRDLLANCLMETGDNDALEALLDQYDDGMATWRYSRALLTFRREGASEAATNLLNDAISYNPHVPPYLLEQKPLPRQLPSFMGIGDDNEAIHYAVDAIKVWNQDPEARAWLQEMYEAHS